MSDVVTWVDCESLLLIASMMVIVAILSDTGFFEHIALYAFQVNTYEMLTIFRNEFVFSHSFALRMVYQWFDSDRTHAHQL